MTERDERWEKVWAEIIDMNQTLDGPNEFEVNHLRFRIEFDYGDTHWWVEQDVHKDDLLIDDDKESIIKWIWNQMIIMMDQNLENEGTYTYWAGSPPTTSPN